MSRKALVLLVCCCDFRDGAERLIPSKSLGNAVIRAFPGLFRILRMCAPRRAAAVVRPRGRKKSADRRRRILISRLLIIRASVPRRKSPFPAYFKGFPAVSPLIPPYPAFLKYPVSPQRSSNAAPTRHCWHRAAAMPPCGRTIRRPPSGRLERRASEHELSSGKIRPQRTGRKGPFQGYHLLCAGLHQSDTAGSAAGLCAERIPIPPAGRRWKKHQRSAVYSHWHHYSRADLPAALYAIHSDLLGNLSGK